MELNKLNTYNAIYTNRQNSIDFLPILLWQNEHSSVTLDEERSVVLERGSRTKHKKKKKKKREEENENMEMGEAFQWNYMKISEANYRILAIKFGNLLVVQFASHSSCVILYVYSLFSFTAQTHLFFHVFLLSYRFVLFTFTFAGPFSLSTQYIRDHQFYFHFVRW